MLIYSIQKRKTYSYWLLVGPATARCAQCTLYSTCTCTCTTRVCVVQSLLIQFEHTRSQCKTVFTTHQLLISVYSVRVRGSDSAPAVCAEFLGPEIGTGWEYRGKCALRQQPWSRLPCMCRSFHMV